MKKLFWFVSDYLFNSETLTDKHGPATAFRLRNYVLSSLDAGYKENQVRSHLSKSGWDKDSIKLVFKEIKRIR